MSGERPLWVICVIALFVIAGMLAPYVADEVASRHERSMRRYRKEWRE